MSPRPKPSRFTSWSIALAGPRPKPPSGGEAAIPVADGRRARASALLPLFRGATWREAVVSSTTESLCEAAPGGDAAPAAAADRAA